MSRYGEDGTSDEYGGYKKEDLFDELVDFVECRSLYDLMTVVTDVIKCLTEE